LLALSLWFHDAPTIVCLSSGFAPSQSRSRSPGTSGHCPLAITAILVCFLLGWLRPGLLCVHAQSSPRKRVLLVSDTQHMAVAMFMVFLVPCCKTDNFLRGYLPCQVALMRPRHDCHLKNIVYCFLTGEILVRVCHLLVALASPPANNCSCTTVFLFFLSFIATGGFLVQVKHPWVASSEPIGVKLRCFHFLCKFDICRSY
jgi:hypothetical protein